MYILSNSARKNSNGFKRVWHLLKRSLLCTDIFIAEVGKESATSRKIVKLKAMKLDP